LLLLLVGWRKEQDKDLLRLEKAVQELQSNANLHVLGFMGGTVPVAMIAVETEAPSAGVIRHIVVQPQWRGQRIGSRLDPRGGVASSGVVSPGRDRSRRGRVLRTQRISSVEPR
jgi:hypothetical protein